MDKNIITSTFIPPEISQSFNSKLLSLPIPKFCDDSETLWKIYIFISKKLAKKCNNHPRRIEKYKLLEEEFLKLYERAKAKETELEKKTGQKNKGPFYYIILPHQNDAKILRRFEYRS